jgi:hypothetical protein
MSKVPKAVTGALAAAIALGLASPASAGPGNGIRLGGSEGRLHPFLELDTRYDSNVSFAAADGASLSDVVLHVRPGITLAVPGETTAVDLRAALDWAQYLGVEGDTTDLSRLYGEASLGIGLNRRGELGLELRDAFRRNTNPTALSLGSAVIANNNALRVEVPWKPGGGALVLTVGGEWQLETYEPYLKGPLCDAADPQCDPTLLSDLGWNELRGDAELRWKFLPRTAAVLEAGYFSRLPNEKASSAEVSGFRASTGFTGLVTPRVAATVKAGYGQTFGDVTLRTWLANAAVEWLASETSSARVGYLHDLGTEPGRSFAVYQSNRVYAEGKILLASRFTARLGASYERRAYERIDAAASLLRVEPAIDVEVSRWFTTSVGYAYTDRTSDLPATESLAGFEYSKNEAWLRLLFTY